MTPIDAPQSLAAEILVERVMETVRTARRAALADCLDLIDREIEELYPCDPHEEREAS